RKTLPAYSSATCKNCVWYTACIKHLETSNDLSLIPELERSRREAISSRIGSIREFAAMDGLIQGPNTVFAGIGASMLEKFHERAKLLSAEDGKPYLRTAISLPVAEKELFFDIEVDCLRDFCYLHGFIERYSGNNQTERFVSFFAETTTADAEERAFSDAVQYMQKAQYPARSTTIQSTSARSTENCGKSIRTFVQKLNLNCSSNLNGR